jgi:small neutral amino acid transporter SnatA (MarC family)
VVRAARAGGEDGAVTTVLINVIVPLSSVLLGAALTYWLNVRERRRTLVEDQFNAAITAVAIADASQHYIKQFARPEHISDDEFAELLTAIARAAVEGATKRAAEAREAIARVIQYAPDMKPFYEDAQVIVERPDEIIDALRQARARVT